MPAVGMEVEVAELGGAEPAVVESVDLQRREVIVVTDTARRLAFRLNPATAQWYTEAGQSGPRLLLR